MKRWKLPLLLLVILCYLQYSLWFGKNNVSDYKSNLIKLASMRDNNKLVKERNERMFAEIDDLKTGLDVIEERARSRLGMIKKDEYFYRIINDSNSQK